MKITFLGTGTSQGVPVIACNCPVCKSGDTRDKRLRTSLLIEIDKFTFVIDAGPDFRQQMLRENVQYLDAILISHEHKDHIGGMDDVRAYNFKSRKPINIYCDSRVNKAIQREYEYVFADNKYPGVPLMDINILDGSPFDLFGYNVIPIPVMHNNLPVFGYRMGGLSYITDANLISSESMLIMEGSDCLVINALRREKHISHFNLEEALRIIEQIKPRFAYITHIGHQLGMHSEISKELPGNVKLAYDGLSCQVQQ